MVGDLQLYSYIFRVNLYIKDFLDHPLLIRNSHWNLTNRDCHKIIQLFLFLMKMDMINYHVLLLRNHNHSVNDCLLKKVLLHFHQLDKFYLLLKFLFFLKMDLNFQNLLNFQKNSQYFNKQIDFIPFFHFIVQLCHYLFVFSLKLFMNY